MTVISTDRDAEALTLTLVAEFDASVEHVWRVWENPRRLERWWGPPTWPATFEQHDFVVGGRSRYFMSGPGGERARGWWRFTGIEAPRRLEFDDGFSDEGGEPVPGDVPIRVAVTLEPAGKGTRMTTVSTFADAAHLDQMLDMGMEEGMRAAMEQIDEVLVADAG